MTIELKKFGTVLISRPAGKEAYLAFKSKFGQIKKDEEVKIDFADVSVLTPSWADEFITPLQEKIGRKIVFVNNENPSVRATLETLRKAKEASKK